MSDSVDTVKVDADDPISNKEEAMTVDSNCPISNSQEVNETEHVKDKDNSNIVENESVEKSESDVNNPYAYLERDEFTSEKFKIEIRGLPKYYGISVGMIKRLYIFQINNT